MIIETERLILREYTWEDFNDLYKILSCPKTCSCPTYSSNVLGLILYANGF